MQYVKMLINRKIDGHPCHRLLPVCFDEDGVKVEIIQCSCIAPGLGYSLIRVTDNMKHIEDLPDTFEFRSSFWGESRVTKISNHQYMAIVINNNCELASLVSESGCFLTSAIPITDTLIEWTVMGPSTRYINNLIDRMVSEGYEVDIQCSYVSDITQTLTDIQEECLRTAYRMGYYDVPKKVGLQDLAAMTKRSPSTLNVILRNAERRIISHYLMTNKEQIRDRKK